MRLLAASCVFVLSSSVWAMEPIPGEERFEGLVDNEDQHSGGAELGFAQIQEDYFLTVTPRLDLNFGKIGLGLQIPLNLRVMDNDPENDDDFYGIIREEDWDETSEVFKVIRYVRYGHKGEFLYARVGELAAEIGHGTIMSRYLNNVDLNTFRVGLQLDLNTDYGGIETIIADVGGFADKDYVDSKLGGARLYFKPMALVDPTSVFNIFQLGTTVISDTNAPAELKADPVDATLPVLDGDNYVVAREASATVYGFDLGIELLRSAMLDLTPYTDLNFINEAGWGWHLGLMAVAKLPIGFDLTIPVRLEYRRFKENYVPAYFSTFYELERYTFPVGSDFNPASPKNRVLREMKDAKGINGYYGDLAFDFAGMLQLGAIYEDYDNADPNLAAFLSVPALDWLQFKAYYARTGITGTDDIFELDERSMVIAEGRYEMFAYTYLVGRWTRRWALETDEDDKDFGTYQPDDSWKVGLEFSVAF